MRRRGVAITGKFIACSLILAALSSLFGCGVMGDVFGKNGSEKTPHAIVYSMALTLFTGANLNSAATGKPLGLVVKIFQLKDDRRFRDAALQDFIRTQTPAAIRAGLGDDLITSRVVNLTPDNVFHLTEQIRAATRYVGIVALFMAPAKQRWRAVFDAEQSRETGITIGLHACALSVTRGQLVSHLPGKPASLSTVDCPARN